MGWEVVNMLVLNLKKEIDNGQKAAWGREGNVKYTCFLAHLLVLRYVAYGGMRTKHFNEMEI